MAGNVGTYIEKASVGKGFEQAKSGLLELPITLLEAAQRCTLTLTEKRAPAGCTVPAPSTGPGPMGSRGPVPVAATGATAHAQGSPTPASRGVGRRP